MKKLNTGEWVAVGVGLAFLTYLFFSGPLINLFNFPMTESETTTAATAPFTVKDVTVGTGSVAASGDKVTAHYVGTLSDGRVFDSSRDRGVPISFTLGTGQVIRGWDEGIAGMREGGKRVLTISPEYGYGSHAVGTIPANSTLIFEVELVKVEKSAQ